MIEPRWVAKAREFEGMREIKGPHHNPDVVALWKTGKAGDFDDDETPWCAAFVSAVLELSEIKSARTGWARGYLKWGQKLSKPCVGAVVVFSRGPTSGHVGFVVGKDRNGHILVLGGNQGDEVNVKPFSVDRVLGYRWPADEPLPDVPGLPVLSSNGKLSSNEA